MPDRDESKLMGKDAPADTSTELSFMPPNGPFDGKSVASTVKGTLTSKHDVDWIAVELSEGNEYTFSIEGSDTLTDTILTLYDGKGGEIKMEDDVVGSNGVSTALHPKLKFTPEAGSGTQKYFIAVSAYTGNPGTNVIMTSADYTVTLNEKKVPATTVGGTLAGTDEDDKIKGGAQNDTLNGLNGDDSLYGMGGDDKLNGGNGDDLLSGGPGADALSGGDGEDTITYVGSMVGVTINLTSGAARGGDADGDTLVDKGNDRIENIIGSAYDDVLTGSRRVNKLWGLDGDDMLDGARGDDKLWGGPGADMLTGGDGDDTLEGGPGADMLTGGAGSDIASYSMSPMGVIVRLHSGQAMLGDAEGDTWSLTAETDYTNSDGDSTSVMLADVEDLTGSAYNDILAGDFRDNTIRGGDGDDTIYGGPNPTDARSTNSGIDNDDTLYGGRGNDRIFGGAGDDMLFGGPGNDHLWGNRGTNTYYGGAGSDMIHARPGDKVDGWVMVMDPSETEAEGDPNAVDTVSFALLDEGLTVDLLAGNITVGGAARGTVKNIENIIGSQDDDTLTGNRHDNEIEGHEGGDTLDGGEGEDTLSYRHSDTRVRVELRDGDGAAAIASRGHASGDTATNFENIRGSAYGDDLTGNMVANKLWGMDGDDDIDGAGGNDTIEGGAGADELDGGYTPANDAGDAAGDAEDDKGNPNFEANTLLYATSNAGVTINLATASAAGGHAEGDTIVTYEESAPTRRDPNNTVDVATFRHITGSKYADSLTGNDHDNNLNGGAGNDTLRGGAGSDRLTGGPGADMLDGGEDKDERNNMVPGDADGNGTVDPGEMKPASIDWAVYKNATAGITVNLATGRGTRGDADGDILNNIELVWGSEHDDIFIASSGADLIQGDGGRDTVSYEASMVGVTVSLVTDNDTKQVTGMGTKGEPFVFGTVDTPTITAGDGNGIDAEGVPSMLMNPGSPFDVDENPETNGAAGDRLGSIENLTGSNQKDTLTGDDNPNVLKGMGGDDMLIGGAGDDKLYGGDGNDIIRAASGNNELHGDAGNDKITGGSGDDTINGGAGDDQLDGGAGQDTFVFSPADGNGDDVISGLTSLENDAIDLSAYNLKEADLMNLIDVFGTNVRIDLTSVGGGKIILDGVNSLGGVGEVGRDGKLTSLKIFNIASGNDPEVFEAGEGGFILVA